MRANDTQQRCLFFFWAAGTVCISSQLYGVTTVNTRFFSNFGYRRLFSCDLRFGSEKEKYSDELKLQKKSAELPLYLSELLIAYRDTFLL